jgi:hypothetical protein
MPTNTQGARGHLERLNIDHVTLRHEEVVTLSYALHGWQLIPETPAGGPPITARVWLVAALNARGRYAAPQAFGHPADLEDGGPLVDAVVLMAIIQRHFLDAPAPGWDDVTLAAQLGLPAEAIARAQAVLDHALTYPLRNARRAPLGAHWWR